MITTKKISVLLTFLILVGIFVPAVSASETQILTDSGQKSLYYQCKGGSGGFGELSTLRFKDITQYPGLWTVYVKTVPVSQSYAILQDFPSYYEPVTLKIGTTVVGTGYAGYNAFFDATPEHNPTGIQLWLDIDSWDIKTYIGKRSVAIIPDEGNLFNGVNIPFVASDVTDDFPVVFQSATDRCVAGNYIVQSSYYWENRITDTGTRCIFNRTIDGVYYRSDFELKYGMTAITDDISESLSVPYVSPGNWTVINPYGRVYSGTLGGSDPDTPTSPTTVYVRNSQTNALIANAHINISASVNGTLHEVVNKTIPSGIYSIELQPTGGGKPNPDFYRLITTAEGYNSIMPYIDFEVDGATTIYAYLDPTGGAPEDENNTFIDFFVRDMSANPISGATVNFGGYTLITNSAGYTIFEVEKDKTYSWTVSKSGYGSLTGNTVIGSNTRHTINTVIAPAVTPTKPTAIPTSTPISPTPTMTAPTGEPVSNWLEWFAAHFGMILGGGVEIGKIFMWLCFSVPVGVYVGKEAKAGAAGFMAGAGIVTLFFVLIGWVPIWLMVLLALIIGLLYAKVFNNSDNGGGR